MEKVRDVIQYKHYFEEFLLAQPTKVQDKIFKVIEIIETYQRVPSTYLKAIAGTKGLYEARIKLGSNIWRVFWLFRQRETGNPLERIYQENTENTKKGNRQSGRTNESVL